MLLRWNECDWLAANNEMNNIQWVENNRIMLGRIWYNVTGMGYSKVSKPALIDQLQYKIT